MDILFSNKCSIKDTKQKHGQFYTTKAKYILEGFELPIAESIRCIVEPFAGQGDLLEWLKEKECNIPVEAYDIDPKRDYIQRQDTLKTPPDYKNTWIITNPPYLARNKSVNKELYDLYNVNDLYKCFIMTIVKDNFCNGGIIIIPAGLFFSPREVDCKCRDAFMKTYRIIKIKYFEETVFDDTTTTIVAIQFKKSFSEICKQNVEWLMMPSREKKIFTMDVNNDWIIGGEIYKLDIPSHIHVRRYVEGKKLKDAEQQTYITLNALDSGTQSGRISLTYKKRLCISCKRL